MRVDWQNKSKLIFALYSVIYKAIDEIKAAMEGMLSPDIEEKIIGSAEIRETFNISKVGTIAGCFVADGLIKRSSKIRIITRWNCSTHRNIRFFETFQR